MGEREWRCLMVNKDVYSADKVPKEWKVLFGGLSGYVSK